MAEGGDGGDAPRGTQVETWERPKAPIKYTLIGWVITAAYLVLVVGYVALRWGKLAGLEPDALATFAAGAFSPLAFLWLVLGFHQQGHELRNSADALWLQGRELQASVEHQRDLVVVTREQLELERQGRLEAQAEAERLLRPDLVITNRGASLSGQGGRYTFVIVNVGGPCSQVTVKIMPDGRKVHFPSMPTNAEEGFEVDYSGIKTVDTKLEVSWRDGRGNWFSQNFYFVARPTETGMVQLYHPEEAPDLPHSG